MEIKEQIIDCNDKFKGSCRTTPFSVVTYKLNYKSDSEDRETIDALIAKAEELADKVNPGAANNANVSRQQSGIMANCIAGIVSEYFWRIYLNSDKIIVAETEFDTTANQIDLTVVGSNKKIEVRSSFPRNGIEFAICHRTHQFDILGPYANAYKPGEIKKDYYVRTLFHMDPPSKIIELIKEDCFEVHLTGGATWNMMVDNNYSIDKDLVAPDDFTKIRSKYRVVPFSKALDTVQIKSVITGQP